MQVLTLLPQGTRTATGNGDVIEIPDDAHDIAVFLNVTAVSGTSPSLTVTVQDGAVDDTTTFTTFLSFAAVTAPTTAVQRGDRLGRYLRVTYTISGTTPSFTFSVFAVVR